jgi:ElaB/YqjD/DUF883 family membrane-anchored ribosome-binding protein
MAEVGNRGTHTAGPQPGRTWPEQQRGGRQDEESSGVLGKVMQGAGNVASSVASAAGTAWDATRQGASAVANAAETAWDSTRSFMRRYPFATFGAGIAVGFLLGMALCRRSD